MARALKCCSGAILISDIDNSWKFQRSQVSQASQQHAPQFFFQFLGSYLLSLLQFQPSASQIFAPPFREMAAESTEFSCFLNFYENDWLCSSSSRHHKISVSMCIDVSRYILYYTILYYIILYFIIILLNNNITLCYIIYMNINININIYIYK